jgi:hypothetical protein
LVSLLNSTSSPADGIRGAVKRLAKKDKSIDRVQYPSSRPHELFKYCSSITFFNVQEEQILNYQKERAHLFNIAAVKVYYCFKPLNSSATITAVTSLSTTFTAHNNTSQVK